MSYEEQEYLNSLTRPARERACRRAWMKQMAMQWGGWLIAALMLAINLATVAN